MRAYRIQYEKMKNSTREILESSAEINTSAELAANIFARKYSDARHKFKNIDVIVNITTEGMCWQKTLVTHLEIASINDDVCTFSYEDKNSDIFVKCFIFPVFIEDFSTELFFVNAQQKARQEVYDFIKGYITEDSDAESALSAALVNFGLED